MTIIISYEEFAELQKKYPRTKSNDFLMPAEIKKLIDFRKLSYFADENALFCFVQREGFSKLIFRLRDYCATLPAFSESFSTPIAAYLVYREDKPPAEDEKWLLSQGFSHSLKLVRYTAHNIKSERREDGISTATAREAYSMLFEFFGAEEMDLPCMEMYDGSAFCTRADYGSLSGVIYDLGHTRIVAVSPAVRGQGLGGRLYSAFVSNALEKGKNAVFSEWIRPDNFSSIAMFEKLGFVKDTLVTDCYVI